MSDPSPKGLCNIIGAGDERPIVVGGVDFDADLVTEVRHAYLVWRLRRTLLALCKAARFDVPTYTWEQWQLCCRTRTFPVPAA